jgi:hypothetical protein
MADPEEIPIVVRSRQVPWSDTFAFLGEDYTGSTLKLQVRQVPGTTTTALITRTSGSGLSIPYAGTATVAAHVAAGRLAGSGDDNIYEIVNPATGVPYVAGDNLTLSQITIAFTVANLTAIPIDTETGDTETVYYDMIRTPASGDPVIAMRGPVIVDPGVTIP